LLGEQGLLAGDGLLVEIDVAAVGARGLERAGGRDVDAAGVSSLGVRLGEDALEVDLAGEEPGGVDVREVVRDRALTHRQTGHGLVERARRDVADEETHACRLPFEWQVSGSWQEPRRHPSVATAAIRGLTPHRRPLGGPER